jgi:hypothetical protein
MNGGRIVPVALLIALSCVSRFAHADEPAAAAALPVAPPAAVTIAAAKAAPVDPTGSWKWEYTFNDSPAEFLLELNWDGKLLTGKYTAFDNTTDIEEATFKDNKLAFVSRREFNGNPFTVHFSGDAETNDVVGTVGIDFGDGLREFDWHAKRVVDAGALLGTWKLHLETPQGAIEPVLTITKAGGKLRGRSVSQLGEYEAKELSLKDGQLSWKIASDRGDDFDFEVAYRGEPRGNKIAGSCDYDFGGTTGTMEFSGERTPPQAKEAKADSAKEPAKETSNAAPAAAGASE